MSKRNRRIVIRMVVGVTLIVALYFFAAGRSKSTFAADSGNRLVMGTFARIVAVAEDSSTANKCIEVGFAEIEKVDQLMSGYKSDSEISEVNRDGAERAVKVSGSTFEVLQRSIEFSKLSGGAFDITIGPLVDLWRSAAEANSAPSDSELAEARFKVGYEKLVLDANEMSVRFAAGGMKIDLGGIAKGYAVDKAAEAMQNCGAVGGMVDIGGDIRCFGVPPEGKDNWLVGLQNPNTAVEGIGGGELLLVLKLTNAAIATSGGYRRFVLIGGERHSHIMDRKTGTSARGLSSVTIITDNAADADALATAVSVMGLKKGLAMIERMPAAEAILVSAGPEFELFQSSGAEEYIKDESIDRQKAQR